MHPVHLRSFPDMHVHTSHPIRFESGDWITVVTEVTGTFTGELNLPDGKVRAPTGKHSSSSSGKRRNGTATA
jgi:hypothetical protein